MPSTKSGVAVQDKRLPKQFGDFAESLVMYVFGRYKKMRVALVDHIGADIIASDPDTNERYAISVKGRHFPANENKGFNFGQHDIEMLRDFADSFALIPVVAFVFADEMEGEKKIRILAVRLDTMETLAADDRCTFTIHTTQKRSGAGIHINYGISTRHNYLGEIRECGHFDYTEMVFSIINEFLSV